MPSFIFTMGSICGLVLGPRNILAMASTVLTRHYISMGLSLLVYDNILCWDKETRYIWKSDAPWAVKVSFCVSRYLALAGQIMNVIYSSPTIPDWRNTDCLRWHWLQFMLYTTAQPTMQQVELDGECLIKKRPPAAHWSIPLTFINQSVFWSLTYRKYRSAIQEGWSDNPLLQLVMRDNSAVFLGLLFSLIPCEVFIQQAIHSAIPIMICVVSIMSSRLILNIRGLRVTSEDTELIEVLTVISVPETQSHFKNETGDNGYSRTDEEQHIGSLVTYDFDDRVLHMLIERPVPAGEKNGTLLTGSISRMFS
ncbi:hypothetical protein D9756_010765 [Leucocoprinus leucothites]|uniref:DUF6533 domain-containing protein n=1 Tax=Leucocoprinus leucothites TaxID=201217 RepID=A0A8H5CVH8_9AGAR|nr:hypothetical protein D9756_010765 [Leucoagaricus leucothites]